MSSSSVHMEQRDLLRDHPQFQQVRTLGSGANGFVLLAQDRQEGHLVAIKLIPRDKLSPYVETEILNHRRLKHAHVIDFLGVFRTEEHLGIVMEYADGGDMFTFVSNQLGGRLDEDSARWWFQQLVLAVDYAHKKGVVNRDIKLENTLLKTYANPANPSVPIMLLKICDFGYSKHESQSDPTSLVGTPAYIAPEIIQRQSRQPYDAKAVDVWTIGVWLYTMVQGHPPFYRPHENGRQQQYQMLQRVLNDNVVMPRGISVECEDLLSRILVKNPEQRISLLDILQHSWFGRGLPMDALSMNDYWLEQPLPDTLQSERDIRDMIRDMRANTR